MNDDQRGFLASTGRVLGAATCTALLFSVFLRVAVAEDVAAILKHFVAVQQANDTEARQYTYLEHAEFSTYEADGVTFRKDRSEDSEIVFVEGLQFKKLLSRDGKPLDIREQAEVEKQMNETAAYRRSHRQPAPGGKIAFGRDHADLGSNEELLTLFDTRLAGEEGVRGRKAWVIEATPKNGLHAANEHQRDVVKFRKKLWIDETDFTLLKIVHTVVGSGMFAKPGTTVTLEYDRIPSGPYAPVKIIVDIHRQVSGKIRPSGRTEYENSRFRKFDVQSTIAVGEPR